KSVRGNFVHVQIVTTDNVSFTGQFVELFDAFHINRANALFKRLAAVDNFKLFQTCKFGIKRFGCHIGIILEDQLIGLAAVAVKKIVPTFDRGINETLNQIGIVFNQFGPSFDRVRIAIIALVCEKECGDFGTFLFGIKRLSSCIGLLGNFFITQELREAVAIWRSEERRVGKEW